MTPAATDAEGAAAFLAVTGIATDVLVLRDGRWRLQAHHVKMTLAP